MRVFWQILTTSAINLFFAQSFYYSSTSEKFKYEGWNFNSGNYLFTTDTK